MRKIICLLISIILVIVTVGLACGPSEGEGETGTLKIGILSPNTGYASAWGLPAWYGALVWEDLVNEAGGIEVDGVTYEVELILGDTQGIGSVGLAACQDLVLQEGVDIIVGPNSEGETAPIAAPFCQDEGVLMLQPMVGGTEKTTSPDWPLVFCLNTDTSDFRQAMYKFVSENWSDVQNVAMTSQDQIDGRISLVWGRKACEDYGLNITYDYAFPVDTADFSALVDAILATEPDLIDTASTWAPQVASIIKELYIRDWDGKYMTSSYVLPLVLDEVPLSYVEDNFIGGWYHVGWGDPVFPEETRMFMEEYEERFPGEWAPTSAIVYQGLRVLEELIELADSLDPETLAAELESWEPVPSPMGDLYWTHEWLTGIAHHLHGPQSIHKIASSNSTEIIQVYYPPFSWDYDLEGIPGAEEILGD